MGASLLVFANKTDVGGCMTDDEIRKVRDCTLPVLSGEGGLIQSGAATRCNQDAQVGYFSMQRNHGGVSAGRIGMGGSGCKRQTVLVLRLEFKGMVCGGATRRIAAPATPRTRPELIGCSWWGADQEKKV